MSSKHKCPHPDRAIFSKGRCKSCATVEYNMKALAKRRQAPVKTKRVRTESDNKVKLNKIYRVLSAELKPLHPNCEGKLPGCTVKATELHHSKGRTGLLLIMSRYFKYLCNNCHEYCTVHSKEAVEIGLSERRNTPTVFEFSDREIELMDQYKVKY